MIFGKIINGIFLIYSQLKYKILMHSFGHKSRIIKPMLISNHKHISVGDNVIIRDGIRLEVVDPQNDIVIKIGNNVNIEQYVHIVARCSVSIGNNVSITGGCSIVDVVHPYDDISSTEKIGNRIESTCMPVSIGDGSFIGFGVHINPGIIIGSNCIIGARSVVTKNVDDYCVAAGNPAKVIKKYNFDKRVWERV
ncbi:acyltransferase [Aeromonas dhakensis]|uniref:acyltransferase n=1 Tax=Aeromonas dhakensis TaxID=196024 RepID=UPI00220A262B|nr:acyltransferase [Aeromonas dhakensis]UXB11407.1 acyltransferase [Aeromonas dhakensis]